MPEVDGDVLELERISRLHMGAYLCIATNGVPPSVSKRIKVSVDCKYSASHRMEFKTSIRNTLRICIILQLFTSVLYLYLRLLLFFYTCVLFLVSPMVSIPHQLVGIPMYFNITLECFIEANPTSLNYWTRENEQMITDSNKYK